MKNKFLTIAGIATCAVALGLNLQNSLSGYGVKSGNLHPEILAQTTGGNSTTGGSGTATGGGTSGPVRTDKFKVRKQILEEKTGEFAWDPIKRMYCRSIYQKQKITCDPGGPDDCAVTTHTIEGTHCVSYLY